MSRGIKCTFIAITILLFCFPCFAAQNNMHVFNTDYFTINLPINIRQVNRGKEKDKNNFTYVFMESNIAKKKSILLVISMNKINNPVPDYEKDTALKDMAKHLRDLIAGRTDCIYHTSGLVETRFSRQKGFYFERRSENCVVTLEKYWVTINGNHAFSLYLAKPVKGDDTVFKRVEKEIVKVKLK